MAQIVYREHGGDDERRFLLNKRLVTLGSESGTDLAVACEGGIAFSLLRQDSGYELHPGREKLRVNGQGITRAVVLRSCDRIEWSRGQAVYLDSGVPLAAPAQGGARNPLAWLQNIAETVSQPGSSARALRQTLDALVEFAGAEAGYLLAEIGRVGEWRMVASRVDEETPVKRRELFSNTIVAEAIRRGEPVHVESIVGHPWAAAASVLEARIFSAACLPLRVGERALGAAFLLTRTPGRSIRAETLGELKLMASQAALLLASRAELDHALGENERLRALAPKAGAWELPPGSPMHELRRKTTKLASTPLPILVLGETGTGKERIARELHEASDRRSEPFVAVNCAAIPGPLLESLLFGHEKGAFTGADRAQPGKFRLAHGGTLFLDEVGDLPLELQAKILRALQEKQVEPLGASRPVDVDVRVVSATHQDLEALVRKGSFRQDLYFRLAGATLRVPPLRERKGDIALLAGELATRSGGISRFTDDAIRALETHSWPGNVRELEQAVQRAAFLAEGDSITERDLDLGSHGEIGHGPGAGGARASGIHAGGEFLVSDLPSGDLRVAQESFTREYVRRALERCSGSRTAAAAMLGVSERTLYRLIAEG